MRLLEFGGIDLVVLGYGPVDTKDHRLGFTGQVGDPKWTNLSLNSNLGNVRNFGHIYLL
jgi:hypothetical protein